MRRRRFSPRSTSYSILHCSDLQLDPAASLEATIIRLPSRSLGGGWWFVIPSFFVIRASSFEACPSRQARDFEAVTGLTKTRSANAGESARGLQWTCFHKGKREVTSASGWLDCLVRRLHLVMHALQISSTWRWSVPQHPPNTFSCFSLLRSSWCWRPNCTGSPSSSSVLSLS